MSPPRYFAIFLFLLLAAVPLERSGLIARVVAETVKDMLAAQVRSQGIVCDNPGKQCGTQSDQSRIMMSGS
jgi:hypothetical protein